MAEATMGGGQAQRPSLFLRNATGLVKAWSTFDAFVYSFWSVNLITLGLYGMSFVYTVPDGQVLVGIILFGVLTTFLVITYAMMVSVMPRTGGDYAWQSRVLGGGPGFVLSITGWWFTLFLWAPIYANILVVQFFSPLAYTLGSTGVATFFTSQTGIFVACLIVLAFVSIVVTMGMETYARIQKVCFWIGLVGLAVMCVLLLFNSQQDFQNAFNRESASLFGTSGNAYQATIDAAKKGGFAFSDFSTVAFGSIGLLLPWLAFYLLWPNWGATLYGEVRGAKDIRKPFWSMFWGLWVTVALVAIVVLLMVKTFGWNFYQSANAAYWNSVYAVSGAPAPPMPIWPYPVMLAGFLVDNHAFQAVLILVMGLWFFGWAGTLFLSSTRVIFAAAFDRVLPSWAANISAKRRVPYGSLVLMIVPSIVVSAIYAYKPSFTSVFLDATAVLALTFLATVVAAIILPWVRKDLYNASPIAGWKVGPIPLISIVGVITALFLGFMLYQWSFNSVNLYGTNLNLGNLFVAGSSTLNSAYYFIATYVIAIAIYVIARIVRRSQGIDLSRIHHEIPVE
jgi:amino acid transporter